MNKVSALQEKINRLPAEWKSMVKNKVNGQVDLSGDSNVTGSLGAGVANCHEAHSVSIHSSFVDMTTGLVKIGDLGEYKSKEYTDSPENCVITDNGIKSAPQFYDSGYTNTYKIETRRGFTIECTGGHKFRDSAYQWVEAHYLEKGNELIIQLGCEWPIVEVDLNHVPYKFEKMLDRTRVEIPKILNADWAELIGWFAAEGQIGRVSSTRDGRPNPSAGIPDELQFTINGSEKEHFLNLLDKCGLIPRVIPDSPDIKEDTWSIRIADRNLAKFFSETLGFGTKFHASEKEIPKAILQGTAIINKAFLSGLYGGDGCVKKEAVLVLSTSSPMMAMQVQQIWRRLGIIAARHSYQEIRTSEDMKNGKKRSEIRAEINSGTLVLDEEKLLCVQWQVQTARRFASYINEWINLPPLKRDFLKEVSLEMSLPLTEKELTGIGSKTKMRWFSLEHARQGKVCGQMLETISGITESETEVRDLVVPSNNTYVSNGFLSHNTQGRWRERDISVITAGVEEAVRYQGAEDAGFYSLTWSLHSQVYSLLLWNYERFGASSLISQRADQASADPNFFKFQATQGQNSTTLGNEGVSQRMRNYFNKSLSEEQLMRAAENGARAGMTGLKLFQILCGLEEPEDVKEFCDFLREASLRTKRIAKELTEATGVERQPMKLNPSFMLLLNMPHSSLQWAPVSSAFDLETDIARPIVDTTRELGFGFRTSLTRDRVRVSGWQAQIGRGDTKLLIEAVMRCKYYYYGPVAKRFTWWLDQNFAKYGIGGEIPEEHKEAHSKGLYRVPPEQAFKGWNYYFREKFWEQLLPSDIVATAMRRDYLWNQWLKIREYQGVAYCLKTSINLQPKCHECGACDPIDKETGPTVGKAKAKMLTRKLEDSSMLIGKEAARKDMTAREKVRFKIEIYDPQFRYAPKNIIARAITRALCLSLEKKDKNHPMIKAFLKVEGHSMKWAEGQGSLPWVCGEILIDHQFNRKWNPNDLKEAIPYMNEMLSQQCVRITDYRIGEKFPEFSKATFGLYTCTIPTLSLHDAQEGIGKLGLKDTYEHKKQVASGKGAYRTVAEIKTRSDVLPVVMAEMTDTGTKITYLASLETNPITSLAQAVGKRISQIKPYPIWCHGYYKYDRDNDTESAQADDGDIFAALAGRELFCEVTGDAIETDIFTGELYISKTGENLCLTADLANLKEKSQQGINTHTALKQ
jgi:hypothetical protein